MFKAPTKKTDFDKWKKAIPKRDIELSTNSFVCSKHLKEEEIIWFCCSGEGDSQIKVFNNNILNVLNICFI